jgi:hypothetical protein
MEPVLFIAFVAIFLNMTMVQGFIAPIRHHYPCHAHHPWIRPSPITALSLSNDNNNKPKSFLDDLKGMLQNFDDVVDDFVCKRMGAGEQWYGKRKYNPSGRVDGDYNGMGRSDYFKIEIARVQKEELELRRQRMIQEQQQQQEAASADASAKRRN